MARVLAVANQKGGVAKTTTTHSLGARRFGTVVVDCPACERRTWLGVAWLG